jgi:creatinine amidohydrolase
MRVRVLVSILAAIVSAAQGGRGAAQQAPKGVRLADLNWQQAADVLRPDTVVVIPLGAAAKEHGPHLKLSNDAIIAEYLTRRLLDSADVVVAPPLAYHFYPSFLEYPGSTSLGPDTARALTAEVASSLARHGPRRFYVLNTGFSTVRPLEAAARTLAAQGILLTFTDIATRVDRASAPVRQQQGGSHADEIETSMMLYIDPSVVDMRRAVKEFNADAAPGPLTRRRGTGGAFSESGVWGDATLATREKGRTIVEAVVAGVIEDVENLRRATPPAPSGAPLPPAAAPAGAQRGQPPSGPRGCTPSDDRTIRRIAEAFTYHWTNADAQSLASLWSDEGDIVHPDGLIERGREVIRANRAALFMRPEYRGSRHPLTMGNVRCVTGGVAVADGKWELRNLSDEKNRTLPTFEGQFTLVVGRSGEGWRIDAYRYTLKPAAVPMPTLLKRPGFPGGA